MISLVQIELLKIFKKWRTYIGFLAIGGLTLLIHFVMHLEGSNYVNTVTRGLQENFFFSGNLLNGYLIGYFILTGLYIHIPFLIVLVGGDILASEATAGTYRLLVTRPVSRNSVIISKWIAGSIYIFILLAFLAFMSLGLGLIFFGKGELLVLGNPVIIFQSSDVIWRFFLAYSFASISMLTVFTISFLFSSLVENAIGPIVATMAIIIVFFVISALDIGILNSIEPFLFTSYLGKWNLFFKEEIDVTAALEAASILIAHTIVLFGLTGYLFSKKDILS